MRRVLLAAAIAIAAAIAVYWFAIRDTTVEATVEVPQLAARIGEGEGAVLVAANGEIVKWGYQPTKLHLPALPLSEPPKSGRLRGTAREQAEVLGAVPPALRRFVASSRHGESGVDVELTSGIELRFGDSSQAERKWKAAAAVLADKSITALSYVDLHSPSHPAYGGEAHALPE
ncbi:MAG: cell division protein FtsQ [Actinobacteria bacterium]|nr:cell division protein FtsQ [Actinomycetota bacterium]